MTVTSDIRTAPLGGLVGDVQKSAQWVVLILAEITLAGMSSGYVYSPPFTFPVSQRKDQSAKLRSVMPYSWPAVISTFARRPLPWGPKGGGANAVKQPTVARPTPG